MESEECETCPLFQHLTTQRIPVGAELACAVHQKLNRSAVTRFGLVRQAWDALGLELEAEQMDALIDQLSAYENGYQQARAEIEAKAAAKK